MKGLHTAGLLAVPWGCPGRLETREAQLLSQIFPMRHLSAEAEWETGRLDQEAFRCTEKFLKVLFKK